MLKHDRAIERASTTCSSDHQQHGACKMISEQCLKHTIKPRTACLTCMIVLCSLLCSVASPSYAPRTSSTSTSRTRSNCSALCSCCFSCSLASCRPLWDTSREASSLLTTCSTDMKMFKCVSQVLRARGRREVGPTASKHRYTVTNSLIITIVFSAHLVLPDQCLHILAQCL